MFGYLLEIRNKLILLVITFFSTLITCYGYKEVLLFLMTHMHLKDENLYFIFTDVTELFSVYFNIVLFISLQILTWYSFYHLFTFLSPAFYRKELKLTRGVFVSATFFWFLATVLSSYVLIPFGWNFFLSFQAQDGFYFEARINEYFNFYTSAYFLCLTYCQLLTFLFLFLVDVGENYLYIKKYRKLHYYVFLIFSTLITPPDLMSQIIITFLTIGVYETIIFVAMFSLLANKPRLVTN